MGIDEINQALQRHLVGDIADHQCCHPCLLLETVLTVVGLQVPDERILVIVFQIKRAWRKKLRAGGRVALTLSTGGSFELGGLGGACLPC